MQFVFIDALNVWPFMYDVTISAITFVNKTFYGMKLIAKFKILLCMFVLSVCVCNSARPDRELDS